MKKKKAKRRKRCSQCGKLKSDVSIVDDPYAKDVNNEIVKMKLCRDCCYERAQDI